jgi:hypothetical protein
MTSISPKIEIINHFDKLINRIDIDIENSLEKYDDKRILGELKINWDDIYYWDTSKYKIMFFNTNDTSKQHETFGLWLESTKVIDYLKQIRIISIEELRKAQEDTIEYYKLNSSRFKSSDANLDQLLFSEKYYFQVHFTQSKMKVCAFNLFTFVTDFYMSSSDITSLE